MNKGIEAQEILQIRQDFPLFRNDPVIYLDNSATTQKPDAVLNAVSEFYGHDNANPFRGIYDLSERATERYEAAREAVSKFIHAESPSEIVFTRNASESLNLAANCLAELLLQPGDEVIVLEPACRRTCWRVACGCATTPRWRCPRWSSCSRWPPCGTPTSWCARD